MDAQSLNPHNPAAHPSGALAGRRIAVTGAGGGIGRATATVAATRGASVLCLDVNADAVKNSVVAIQAAAPDVKVLGKPLDCTDSAAATSLLAGVANDWGGLDGLVNVAGMMFAQPLSEFNLDDMERIFRVNLGAMLVMSRAALPVLRPGSVIVNVGSANAQHVTPGLGIYGASKAANQYMTRVLAVEFAEYGIRVCGVGPGAVNTAFPRSVMEPGPEAERMLAAAVAEAQIIPRMSQPEEIAAAINYLLSDEASFIYGSTMWIDGGCTAAY